MPPFYHGGDMNLCGYEFELWGYEFACSLNELRINNFFGFFQMLIIINIYLFYDGVHFSNSFTYTPRNIHLLRPAKGSYLFLSRHLRSRFVGDFVWTFRSLFRCFTSSQSPPHSTLSMLTK